MEVRVDKKEVPKTKTIIYGDIVAEDAIILPEDMEPPKEVVTENDAENK